MTEGVTHGHLLGGRVRYAQPDAGFRSGIEPVLLAAAIGARPGERMLEGGSGAGGALLCLARRVPDIAGLGIEIDPVLVEIARANAAANAFPRLDFRADDLLAGDLPGAAFDHAFANPPYHPHAGTGSPESGRERAKRGGDGLLAAWCQALAGAVRRRGTVTLILPAATLGEATGALRMAGCGGLTLLPLWPRAGSAAKLMLLRGVKDSRAPDRIAPGLVLHDGDGFTPATHAVLRDGAALPMV